MGVPAIVVAEVTKCGGQLLKKTVGDITQFNLEKMRFKSNVIKSMGGLVTVYEGNNKIYIESSEKNLEKILNAIPDNADPDQIVELLRQSQRNHNILLRTGMFCGTIVLSVTIHSIALVLSASAGKPITINNTREINLIKREERR